LFGWKLVVWIRIVAVTEFWSREAGTTAWRVDVSTNVVLNGVVELPTTQVITGGLSQYDPESNPLPRTVSTRSPEPAGTEDGLSVTGT
jgi:hypothetical protein